MTETLKDMMAVRADASPGPDIDIQAVMRNGQRRMWRRRAVGGTAACAALAALTWVVGGLPVADVDDGRSPFAASGGFEARKVTYASGSTIHYGDRGIDVSPHTVTALVQTDDGFTFTTPDDGVYFTDGTGTERIGHTTDWPHLRLAADDHRSYVGWFDGNDAVVFDTAIGQEVLRTSDGIARNRYSALRSIERGVAYVQLTYRSVAAWDLSSHTRTLITAPEAGDLTDVANEYKVWDLVSGGALVGRQLDATGLRLAGGGLTQLSPDATYVKTISDRIIERTSREDVTPDIPVRRLGQILQWLDRDRYVMDTVDMHTAGPVGRHDLLTCSISAGTCTVAVELVGKVVYPDGFGNQHG